MKRFYIEGSPLGSRESTIAGPEARHIRTVMRMRPGDLIELVDGSGYAYKAEITELSEQGVQVMVHRRYPAGTEPHLRMTAAVGFLKEKKMDFLVRHLTELGITRFLPVWSARSIPRPPEKRIAARIERWQSIAREAVKQSRRGRIPEVLEPAGYTQALEMGAESDAKFIFWEGAESSLKDMADIPEELTDVFLMLGPEGGFTTDEARQAAAHGFYPVFIGPRILRAETAAITACALVQYLFGDMDKKSP